MISSIAGAPFELDIKTQFDSLSPEEPLWLEPEERISIYRQLVNDNADKIREELKDKGIIIKDTREGTIFEIVK